ncbi:MAG: hypothetical protein ACI9IN_000975, partial [Porticoccaceae bacterium]
MDYPESLVPISDNSATNWVIKAKTAQCAYSLS